MKNAIATVSFVTLPRLLLAVLALGICQMPANAGSGIIGDYPDVLVCTGTNDSVQRVYYIGAQDANEGIVHYRHVYSIDNDWDVDYRFNGDGTFNANVNSPASNCDNATLSTLVDNSAAFFTKNSSAATSGQMAYFNLESCPDEWTRQIQLDRTINPDEPMVLCRKD